MRRLARFVHLLESGTSHKKRGTALRQSPNNKVLIEL